MSAYIIASITVTNREEYMKYASQTVALAEKYGGSFLVKGGAQDWVEGSGADRHAVIRFDDMAAARRWYDSAEYQAILPLRLANSEGRLVIVEGV